MSRYALCRGPCEEFEVLGLDPDTLEPACVLNTSRVSREEVLLGGSGSGSECVGCSGMLLL